MWSIWYVVTYITHILWYNLYYGACDQQKIYQIAVVWLGQVFKKILMELIFSMHGELFSSSTKWHWDIEYKLLTSMRGLILLFNDLLIIPTCSYLEHLHVFSQNTHMFSVRTPICSNLEHPLGILFRTPQWHSQSVTLRTPMGCSGQNT